jgi:hypothetical protein
MQLAPTPALKLQQLQQGEEKTDTGHKVMDTVDGQAQVGHLGTGSLWVNVFIFYAVDN